MALGYGGIGGCARGAGLHLAFPPLSPRPFPPPPGRKGEPDFVSGDWLRFYDAGRRVAALRAQIGAPPVVVTSHAWARRQWALARPADTGASMRGSQRTARCAPRTSGEFGRPAASRTDPSRQSGSRAARPACWRRTCTLEAARTAGSPISARRSAPRPHAPKTRSRREATKSGLPFPPRRGRKGAGGIAVQRCADLV